MNTRKVIDYETTLLTVRELSENAMLRPAPNQLRCIPVKTCVLKPIPAWKARKFIADFSDI